MPFAREYLDCVLKEHFNDARTHFLGPLMAIHQAHLVMLTEQGIVSREDARRLHAALDALGGPGGDEARFDAGCEDLFFYVEQRLEELAGADVAGRLHTARSRNDIDMTMYRMCQRDMVLDLTSAVLELRGTLGRRAASHHDAVMPAYTHTQPAQPTTLAHYLLGVIEQLERDTVRLRAAFATTNRNPLGACAITGTGFAIDRGRTSELLGFDAPTGNTYGSIATVDYLLENLSVLTVLLVGLGRFIQDLLFWCTAEVGYLRLSDGFVQTSSIMPQKRNPVALEHARAIASKAVGQAQAAVLAVHNTPFGDVVDTEDDLQPLVVAAFRDAVRTVRLLSAALGDAEFDTTRMAERAGQAWITSTELADAMVRDFGLPFRQAHAVAARFVDARRADPASPPEAALERASAEVTGAPLPYSADRVQALLDPAHFIAVRTTPGGPAPETTRRALARAEEQRAADAAWLARMRQRLDAAAARLAAAFAGLA